MYLYALNIYNNTYKDKNIIANLFKNMITSDN